MSCLVPSDLVAIAGTAPQLPKLVRLSLRPALAGLHRLLLAEAVVVPGVQVQKRVGNDGQGRHLGLESIARIADETIIRIC